MKSLPLCYFPTTLHFVDDYPSFPESIIHSLTAASTCVVHSRPDAFLAEIKTKVNHGKALSPYLDALKKKMLYEDAEGICTILADYLATPKRFLDPAVVVVDYTMPGMNGLGLSQIMPAELKKVMLTGEADQDVAVQAFNEGIIDRFMRKEETNLAVDLNKAILQLSFDYFYELTQNTLNSLKHEKLLPAYFSEAAFREAFIALWQQEGGVEFYLLGRGNFVCITAEAKAFMLCFRDEKDLLDATREVEQEHLAEPREESEAVLADLKEKKALLILPFDQPHISVGQWQQHLYPLHKLMLKDKPLYYAKVPLNHERCASVVSLVKFQQS